MQTAEWLVLLAGHLTRRAARKQRHREVRRQLAEARAAGLKRRHAERQQRMRAASDTRSEATPK